MTEVKAPERIALIPSDGWSWTTWPITHQDDAIEYRRADLHAELLRAADEVESWLIAILDMHGLSYTSATAALTAYKQAKEKMNAL